MSAYEPMRGQPLTPAEQKVYDQLIEGLTHKEIAKNLFISDRTSKFHCYNIRLKLNAESNLKLIIRHYKSLLAKGKGLL